MFGVGASKTDHRADAATNSGVPGRYICVLFESTFANRETSVADFEQFRAPHDGIIEHTATAAALIQRIVVWKKGMTG